MGAGKTTIGRQLAKRSSSQFYDSDYEIEQRTGADISLIFELEGEDGFRKRESEVLAELVLLENIVLSTGGGSILDPVNRKALIDNGMVVYLKSTAEKLFMRTADDKRRPLLQTVDRQNYIKKILDEREPIYIAMADEVIDTQSLSIKQITEKILEISKAHENH